MPWGHGSNERQSPRPFLDYCRLLRSRDGGRPEFIAKEIQRWLDRTSVGTLHIQNAGPWENECAAVGI